MLIGPRHLEVGEDQREDEQVVDREALLQQPRGGEVDPRAGAESQAEDEREDQRYAYPDAAPDGGLAEADDVGAAVREDVDREHHRDDAGEREPGPQGHVHNGRAT